MAGRLAGKVCVITGTGGSSTVFGFAILVGLGVAVSGWALLGRRP
jgi:hypothetical protein